MWVLQDEVHKEAYCFKKKEQGKHHTNFIAEDEVIEIYAVTAQVIEAFDD